MIERGFSSAGQRRHRLPEQARAPIAADIEFVFNEALRQPGELIELPWVHNKERYLLTAKLERRSNDQCHQWSFYQGDGPSSKLKWMYESSDVAKVHNLVMNSIPVARKGSYQSQAETLQLRPDDPPVVPGEALHQQRKRTTKTGPKGSLGVLEGNLAQMPLASLLNSIASSHLTGRLSIQQDQVQTDLYFEEGRLVGADRQGWLGEDAFFEIALNPQIGDFKFFNTDHGLSRNIQDRIDSLLLKAAALTDQNRFLEQAGLKGSSRLFRANPNLTERDFENAVAGLVPIDLNTQKVFYQLIDNRSQLSDLVLKSNLNRLTWTPIMFNLLSSRLITLDTSPLSGPVQAEQQGIQAPDGQQAHSRQMPEAFPPQSALPLEIDARTPAIVPPGEWEPLGQSGSQSVVGQSSTGSHLIAEPQSATGSQSVIKQQAEVIPQSGGGQIDASAASPGQLHRGVPDDQGVSQQGVTVNKAGIQGPAPRNRGQRPITPATTLTDIQAADRVAPETSLAQSPIEAASEGVANEQRQNEASGDTPDSVPKIDAESTQPAQQEAELYQPASMEELGIDLDELEAFTRGMTRPDTGIYSEIAFLFFLEHEFYRFHSYDTPFTVVLLSLADKSASPATPVTVIGEARKHIVELIKNTVRKADILGHYDGDDYGVILPHTDSQGAQGLVNRLSNLLAKDKLGQDIALLCGVAGIPHDCQDLLTLLTIARHRKNSKK